MAMDDLRLLVVAAHPDDESLGFGGMLARYGAEGVETHLVTATLGERGRIGTERPGPAVVGPVRERELRQAAAILGVSGLELLGFHDGELARVGVSVAVARLVSSVRRTRPQVVVTFGADGAYGHPDHIAVSQWTSAALVAAADPDLPGRRRRRAAPGRQALLDGDDPGRLGGLHGGFRRAGLRVDGVERRAAAWPDWEVTTELDTREHWERVWSAVQCHQSQITGYGRLADFPLERHVEIWGHHSLYRVFSSVDVGPGREQDLFQGLRAAS